MVEHIFVYGTLKSGQVRASMWPLPPVQISRAWTLGRLYDIGPYPALVPGCERVAGQLWTFHQLDMIPTLEVLDRIEGTNQPGFPNEYDRETVRVYLQCGQRLQASVYLYARPHELQPNQLISPHLEYDQHLYSIWPRNADWSP